MNKPIPNRQCDACARDGIATESNPIGLTGWLTLIGPFPGGTPLPAQPMQQRLPSGQMVNVNQSAPVDICPVCKMKYTLVDLAAHLAKPIPDILTPATVTAAKTPAA